MNLAVNELVHAQLMHRSAHFQELHPRIARLIGEFVRMRFQIFFGLIVTLLIPILVRRGWSVLASLDSYADPGPMGNVIAFLLGFYIFRRVSAFPGVRTTSSVIPAFTTAYGLVACFYLFLRLDYRAGEFALSYVTAVGFIYLICFLARRARRLSMMVVAAGQFDRLLEYPLVDWYVVDRPEQAAGNMAIVADLHAELSDDWVRFITDCALEGRPVYNLRQVRESLTGRIQIDHLSENIFGTVGQNEIWASLKRYVDFVAALAALLGAFWLLALVSLVIRLESKGPAIFRQQRIGFGGRPFTIYKFRTMRLLTPEQEASNKHFHDADRITRFGAFLRRSRLDELPQLFNILKGEMSWIGPRPEAHSLSVTYESHLPFYRYRHIVRPGISGWAQVNQGHVVGVEDANHKLQYDFFYIRNFSLWLDILVGLRTFRVILMGTGAR